MGAAAVGAAAVAGFEHVVYEKTILAYYEVAQVLCHDY